MKIKRDHLIKIPLTSLILLQLLLLYSVTYSLYHSNNLNKKVENVILTTQLHKLFGLKDVETSAENIAYDLEWMSIKTENQYQGRVAEVTMDSITLVKTDSESLEIVLSDQKEIEVYCNDLSECTFEDIEEASLVQMTNLVTYDKDGMKEYLNTKIYLSQ